jgi:serine/threonine-protein kinase PknG
VTIGGTASRGHLGAGLVAVPAVPARDPITVVLDDPLVPESKRYCGRCDGPVGRSRDDRPGRTEGFCPKCRQPYSFVPKLKPGVRVGGQYEVVGCLAHGGLGWVYLARDRNVSDRWVVLKGILNSGDESAMLAAIAERRFLAQVEHPNIVRIYNFVEHEASGYIVMEYVGGQSLKELRRDEGGAPGPIPAAIAIAYMIEALPALGYLHARGLLYCDFKPDNVIHTDEQLKIIDLGGVVRMGDDTSDVYGTVGYQAPEIAEEGPSIASDLYTVGRTLLVMMLDLPGFQNPSLYAYALPPVAAAPIFSRYPSLHRFLLKATHRRPERRFQSAAEMSDQLIGVLRQVLAADGERRDHIPSRLFSPDLGGALRRPDWRSLPIPLVSPDDPAAGMLTALSTAGPAQVLAALSAAPSSRELQYAKVRAQLDMGEVRQASDILAATAEHEEGAWRKKWWEALVALAGDNHRGAQDHFGAVAGEMPGELAPILGMAVAQEVGGDFDGAEASYGIVATTDHTYVTATFGLSRMRQRNADLKGAVDALREVPSNSSAYQAARAAMVSVLAGSDGTARQPEDLIPASDALAGITGDVALRTELTSRLMLAALDALLQHGARPDIQLAGVPFEEVPIRQAVERSLRALAKLAQSDAERHRLVDEANAYRPRSLL